MMFKKNMMPLYLNFQFKGLYEFAAAIHGISDDTESQFAVFTATHPPGHINSKIAFKLCNKTCPIYPDILTSYE